MNEDPALKSPTLLDPEHSVASEGGNQDSNVNINDKFPKFWKSYWKLIAFVVIVVILVSSNMIYKATFESNLVIKDQNLDPTLEIKRLNIKRGSFLVVDSMRSPSKYLVVSEYIPPGLYENFGIPYLMAELSREEINNLRAFVYEDTKNDQSFDIRVDKPSTNIFGDPLVSRFKVENQPINVVSCANGFNEEFEGSNIDGGRWSAYIWNNVAGGQLQQSAINNLFMGNSTNLYSHDQFSGNVEVRALIQSFDGVGGSNPELAAGFELTMFTLKERVASVKWNKLGTESYLTLGLDPGKEEQLSSTSVATASGGFKDKFIVPGEGPLGLKLSRHDSTVSVSRLSGNGVYEDIWNVPYVSTEHVYIGIETTDVSNNPHEVTSVIENISIGCASI